VSNHKRKIKNIIALKDLNKKESVKEKKKKTVSKISFYNESNKNKIK
jgi:hypothetical protein